MRASNSDERGKFPAWNNIFALRRAASETSSAVGLLSKTRGWWLRLRPGVCTKITRTRREAANALARTTEVELYLRSRRGYDLAVGLIEPAIFATPIKLDLHMHASEAFRVIARSAIRHFAGNADAVRNHDPEGILLRNWKSARRNSRTHWANSTTILSIASWRSIQPSMHHVRTDARAHSRRASSWVERIRWSDRFCKPPRKRQQGSGRCRAPRDRSATSARWRALNATQNLYRRSPDEPVA